MDENVMTRSQTYREPIIPEIDSFYEFHATELEPVEDEEDELNHQTEDNEIVFTINHGQDNGKKSNSHQTATRIEPSLPNSISKRQFMRRRSISLTNVDTGAEGGSGDGNGNSDSSSILQLRGAATFENLLEKGEECDILGRVPLRKSKNFSQTSLCRMRRSGSSSLDLDDEEGFKGRRPNSVLVHDNEELLKLAEELEIMNMVGHDIQDMLDRCPKSPSPHRKLSSNCKPTARTTLVRRNSSGYHSGGSGTFAKCGKPNDKDDVQSHPHPESASQMAPLTQLNVRSHATPKIGHYASKFEDSPKQNNIQSSAENHSKTSRLSTISSLFGASKRSSMQSLSTNPSKPVRKYDRQSSSSSRSSNKITGKSSQNGESNYSDDKRSNFIQSRSSTALQLLSTRRKSLAVTENDAYAAMRSAKSQTDLTKSNVKPSPLVVRKKATPGPGITDLKEAKTPKPKRSSFLNPNFDSKSRLSFKERSWTEIERLWKGKVKEPPNIEHVFIKNEKARAKNRSERSKTIPLSNTLPPKTSPALARVASHHGSPGVYRVCPSSPQSRSTSTLSPRVVNKSVDLLSPQVMEAWQISHGYLSERHHRNRSMPFLSGMTKSPSIESTPEMDAHFENLLLVWDAAAAANSSPKTGNRVDRSQSLRDQEAVSRGQKRGTPGRERRKNSDPNLPRGRTRQSDVEVEIPTHQQTTSSGSSTSSLSASRSSVDSPAGSQEMVTAASASALPSSATPISSHSQASQSFRSSGPSSVEHHYHTIDGDDFETPDSDYENPTDDWRKALAKEDLDRLGKKESQRQDVINELFNTERSHVKNLRVLDQLFYRPLMAETACTLGQHKEFVESLFPNLPDVLAWHTKCNQKMKDKVKRLGYPVGNIGDILSEMFDGANGDKLIEIGSTFTKNQKFTIEELKDRRKRDQRFDKFLIEYESKPQCRRLQLQALLPMEHQRLVKYPLLVSQLLKRSSEICDKTELDILQNCQERTRVILDNIDRRVAQAQNIHKMAEIQKNLDTTGLEKFPDSPICKEFRRVDLTKHTLLYDGILTMKLGKTKTVDLHVLLLEDCVMLLQKQDDKYLLKYHMTNSLGVSAANQANMGKACFAPIIKVSNLLIRPNATDKRSFYLLNNSPNGPQFYELATQSSTDRSQWFKHITEANNAFSSRDESQRSSGDRSGTDLSSQNGPLDGSSQPGGASNDLLGGPGYEGGKAAGRSESFKGSKTEVDRGSNEESVSKKTGGGTTSQSNDPANTSSSGQRKRLQRVEILKIAEPCPLIDPSQVVVTQGEIFMAEPILTPIEKLRRKDLEVARALEEKKQLIAEILNVPKEHFDDIADIASSQPSQDKDAREVLLAALAQAKCLSDLVNQSLNLSDEERILVGSEVSMNSSYTRNTSSSSISTREQQRPLSPSSGISGDLSTAGSGPSSLMSSKPSSSNLTTRNLNPLTLQAAGKFVSISVNLNSHLTTLLGMIQERDEERERMKQELQRSKEQVHAYLSQSTSVVTSSMSAVSPGSRPASFISVEESSGTGDLSEKGTQESGGEDDGALPTNMYENISSSDQDLPEPVTPTNAKPMEDPPASSSDDSPSSPGPYTSLNKEESLENSPSDSDKTVTESTPTYNAEAQSLIESDPGPDVSEDSARANATSSSSTSPVQKTEE